MTVAILAVGVVGMLMDMFVDAIMYVAIPMMGGGMGAGVVPLSGMYAQALDVDAAGIISRMILLSTLGNVTAIVMAGMLNKSGQVKPSLSGDGKLMCKNNEDLSEEKSLLESIKLCGMGLIIAMFFYLLGTYINKAVPAVHTYAWMIILVAAAKALGIVPSKLRARSSAVEQLRHG